MEMNFKKLIEVFAHNKPIYKNLFLFIHKCHIFEVTNPSLSPSFQQFSQIFRAKNDLLVLQVPFSTSSISPWIFDANVEEVSAPDRNILNLPYSDSEDQEEREDNLAEQFQVGQEEFPSPTPKEDQGEQEAEASSSKPRSQRIN